MPCCECRIFFNFSNKPGLLWCLDSAICRELSKISCYTTSGPILITKTDASFFYSYLYTINQFLFSVVACSLYTKFQFVWLSLILCFHSGNVQRAIPPWLDRVLPFWQRHTHQESECLGCAQRRQSREPEWVDVARRSNLGLGPNHETLPPAERESKQTSITDKRFRTSYNNKPHTNIRHHQ